MQHEFDLLIKIPSRNRPEQFIDILQKHAENLESTENVSFLLTFDADDDTMNNKKIKDELQFLENIWKIPINYMYGESSNKIHAINRDLEEFIDWDILILSSDDMQPIKYGYDTKVRDDMETYFPDLDGVLYYPDGFTPLNTMPIMGKKYYDRFGYIYDPRFVSFFCDNCFHEIADILHRQHYSKIMLFKHLHPCNTMDVKWDELYKRNDGSWNYDKFVYNDMKNNNFYLGDSK